jgi:hypothetical protein
MPAGAGVGTDSVGAEKLGAEGRLDGMDGGVAFVAVPAIFSCVLPKAAIPNTAPIAR